MMYPPDEVHTSFITDHANYCYRVMPFGLKNAGATYQRLMDKVFHQQIGRNMESHHLDAKPTNDERDQCEEAFQSFKTFLTTPPILQRPDNNTDLLLYLLVAENAISAVIVQEHQKVQTPIYFISRVLQDAERRYHMIEKLVLALVTAARRLRPYF
uniref:Retrovirus-related Pol polyprotein from transposon 297 family n=1 Tax=Cajanus cajan TaxID=3821 RepID=A0A151S9Y3_CAJCA|nr:Retrovirus-related Pol polyprotein from transposon 297 family [Cajanus cajan]